MTTPFWRRPLVQAGLVALFLLLVGIALYYLRQPLMPFAVALGLAYFLNPVANGLERVFQRSFGTYPLRGKDLVCWCSLDDACHADVLLEAVA